jgi:hypothetical protein
MPPCRSLMPGGLPAMFVTVRISCSSVHLCAFAPNIHVSPLQIEAQANEHEALKVDGFPGIFLYPSGKDQTPIPYAGYDRSLKVHKHARLEIRSSGWDCGPTPNGSAGCGMHLLWYYENSMCQRLLPRVCCRR